MNQNNTLIGQLKRGLLHFCEKLSDGLTGPMMKFLSQMLYGLLVNQSIMLSDIARALQEDIPLIKTENRLSRNLKGFSENITCVWGNYLEEVKPLVDDETIFCLDPGDICKKYSRHQEGLDWIEDGSSHKPSLGWQLIGVTALTHGNKLPIPVYSELLAPADIMEDTLTEGIVAAISSVQRSFGGPTGIFSMDRAMDTNAIYGKCFDTKQRFIIRAKVNRNLIVDGKTINITEVARRAKGKYRMDFTDKHDKTHKLKVSFVPVFLPDYPDEPLSLVVVYGYEYGDPMLLLTNLPIQGKGTCLRVLKTYLCRWRIEENYRFIKNQFHLENIRVRSLASVRSLVFLITVLTGWIVIFANKRGSSMLVEEVLNRALRLFEIPNFTLYAVADGIYNIMKFATRGISAALSKPPRSQQLSLFNPYAFNYSAA
ncbi:MAG: transposase [Peptococcaceae bacterium]|nr:transposase [Peptococcaceae bacterium]